MYAQGVASSREALVEITGPAQLTIQPLKDEFPLQGPDPDSVNDWLKAAAEGNLDLLASEINSDIAGKDVKINSSRHLPTVDAIVDEVSREAREGDLVVIMSNGAFGGIYQKLLSAL